MEKASFTPGEIWKDLDGIPIQAHGGAILFDKGTYYWFGENKDAVTHQGGVVAYYVDAIGISCYASVDLYHWENKGIVLPTVEEPAEHELHKSKVIERPRVVYNPFTHQYVMFVHVDRRDYSYARVGIAVSSSPTGPYDYIGSIAPHHSDSRDLTVFQEADGKSYLIYSSEWNSTILIGELDRDYCQTNGVFSRNFSNTYREAPAIFKREGKYYLLTSGCTGWDPNRAEYALADQILGPWKVMGNPCKGPNSETTFNAQSTFIFPVVGKTNAYVAMFDLWNKEDLGASGYIWLPVQFENEQMIIEWQDEWDLSFFK